MEPAEEMHSPEVYRVAERLPPFWPDQPAIWFAQAEAQFQLAAITRQQTKFNYVVSQLNQQQAAEVEDIITSPPEHEPYDRLKVELVRRLSTSCEQHVRQLLSHEEMGDRKPSQFLRHLRGLATDVPDDFLRTIWTSRLPPHVQAILAGQTEGSLGSTSHLADKICKDTIPTTAKISPATTDNTAMLLERIEELTRQVASLQASQTRSRSHSINRRRNTPNYHSAPSDICWYHLKFGDQARKCTPPCSRQQRKPREQREAPHQNDSRHQENSSSGR